MKKFFPIALLLSVVVVFFSSFKTKPAPKNYAVKLGYTCETMQVAVDSVFGSFNGSEFEYRIKYCSQKFTAPERYIKFTLQFVDRDGNVLAKTSTGPVLNNKQLSGCHIGSVPVGAEPYDCIISWSFKDVTGGYKEVTEPDGTVIKQRDAKNDVWQLMSVRSLKLYK